MYSSTPQSSLDFPFKLAEYAYFYFISDGTMPFYTWKLDGSNDCLAA